jgi:hypothetical protein
MEANEVAAGSEESPNSRLKGEAQQKANQGMKKGGKVSSASSRADGCCCSWQNQRADGLMEHVFLIGTWSAFLTAYLLLNAWFCWA